jgi:hypothetical protein
MTAWQHHDSLAGRVAKAQDDSQSDSDEFDLGIQIVQKCFLLS